MTEKKYITAQYKNYTFKESLFKEKEGILKVIIYPSYLEHLSYYNKEYNRRCYKYFGTEYCKLYITIINKDKSINTFNLDTSNIDHVCCPTKLINEVSFNGFGLLYSFDILNYIVKNNNNKPITDVLKVIIETDNNYNDYTLLQQSLSVYKMYIQSRLDISQKIHQTEVFVKLNTSVRGANNEE